MRGASKGPSAPVAEFNPRVEEARMRKLRLDIESLSVESFPTGAALTAVGTVHGQGTPSRFACTQQYSCASY
ncbi:MAG: hypothetical protein JWM27_4352 [Gemmatimonadetes bacterium]|nr:hypothetical protein [Gemmatimonadota bacterium]